MLEVTKEELINDLISISTILEELWRYHPDNISKIDIVEEYKLLQSMGKDIEFQIQELNNNG